MISIMKDHTIHTKYGSTDQRNISIIWLALVALGLGILLSSIIPPMKSPDEGDHVRRAYLFSEGYWLLESQDCPKGEIHYCRNGKSMSGGLIDNALADYLDILHPRDFYKHSQNQFNNRITKAFHWQDQGRFVTTPGTGYYLPLIYLPQAAGLKLGKITDMSIDASYRLARLFSLLTIISIMVAAFKIHRFPMMVMAVLILPTSLFQAVSTSIDALSASLAVLSVSCFLSVYEKGKSAPKWIFLVMTASLIIVCGSRAHLLPMLSLMIIASALHRSRTAWACTLLTISTTGLWLSVAIPATIDLRIPRTLSTGEIALFYFNNPLQLIRVLVSTLSDKSLLNYYSTSFVGNFFNSSLTTAQHTVISAILVSLFACSVPTPSVWKEYSSARLWMIATGIGSALLTFIAMLLTWTDHPASVVHGVQGRYFTVPTILVLMGLCAWDTTSMRLKEAQRWLLFTLLILGTTFLVLRTLSTDYTPIVAVDEPVPIHSAEPGRLSPGPALTHGNALSWSLHISDRTSSIEKNRDVPISGLGILLGTYTRKIDNLIKISATSKDGIAWSKDFSLKGARDNDYFFMKIPTAEYSNIRIDVLKGDLPFTVWHVERDSDHNDGISVVATLDPSFSDRGSDSSFAGKQACFVAIGGDNKVYMTAGCPSPGF